MCTQSVPRRRSLPACPSQRRTPNPPRHAPWFQLSFALVSYVTFCYFDPPLQRQPGYVYQEIPFVPVFRDVFESALRGNRVERPHRQDLHDGPVLREIPNDLAHSRLILIGLPLPLHAPTGVVVEIEHRYAPLNQVRPG